MDTELSVHGDTRSERREEARIYERQLKMGITESRAEPGQRPELGSGLSLEGDQEEFLLDSLSFRCLHPLTIGCESLILPGELQGKDTNLKSTECSCQLIPRKCIPIQDKELGLLGPSSTSGCLPLRNHPSVSPQNYSPLWPYCNCWTSPARHAGSLAGCFLGSPH